jgi:hypothetical protein
MNAIDWRMPEPEEPPNGSTGRAVTLSLLAIGAGLVCAFVLAMTSSDIKAADRGEACFGMPGSDVAPINCANR